MSQKVNSAVIAHPMVPDRNGRNEVGREVFTDHILELKTAAFFNIGPLWESIWFCSGLMDTVKLSYGSPLKVRRADVAQVTMATFSVIETFNVVENVRACFIAAVVDHPVNPLTL